jgi:hypothetical protein
MLKNVLIGTDVAYTTAANPSLLTAGQIGVYSLAADGTYTRITGAISAAQNLLPIVIAQGPSSGRNVKTFTINPKSKLAYATATYVAPIPNVWVVGYDGSTYDMNSGVAGTYTVSVKNLTEGNPPYPMLNASAYFTTTTSATSIAISQEVAKQINSQSTLDANATMPVNRFAFASILSAATRNSASGQTGTCTVINGSNIVTTTTLTSATAAPAVDGWVALGSTTATTAPVYKIIAVSGSSGAYTLTLDQPYYNTQIALGSSITSLPIVTLGAVTGASGVRIVEFGNRFNGGTYLEAQPNLIMNVSASGNLSGVVVQNNQTVARSYIAAAGTVTSGIYTEGLGTSAQIFKKELTADGYIGFQNRTFIPDNFPIYTVAASTYNTIGLQFKNIPNDYTATGVSAGDTQEAILAIAVGTNQYADLVTILSSTNW